MRLSGCFERFRAGLGGVGVTGGRGSFLKTNEGGLNGSWSVSWKVLLIFDQAGRQAATVSKRGEGRRQYRIDLDGGG